jgi:cobalt/nickel transport system permease protein
MSFIERNFLDIRNLDLMARQTSWVHRVDPRAKVFTTLIYIIMVISVDKYAIAQLVPFLIFPVVLVGAGNLPAGYFLKKIALVAPFAILLGIFNPLIDRSILLHLGPVGISGGWVSFTSLVLRFGLTVGGALIVIAVTGFTGICLALLKFRVPRVFVTQLLFLYRYIFVLIDEACRMARARALRALDTRAPRLSTFSSMLGYLLLKATARAERIHLAMCCRGYDGNIRLMTASSFRSSDALFVCCWTSLFVLFRLYNLPQLIGATALEIWL